MLASTKRQGEIGTALVLLGTAFFLITSGARMPSGTVALPGPGFMPLAIGIFMAAVAGGLLIGKLKTPRGGSEIVNIGSRHFLVAAAGLAWTGLFFERLGFLICMGMFLLILSKEFSQGGWLKPILFSVVSILGAYWFFVRILGVQLPLGPF
jgi:putative tricarboxylic transport membrane protein